MELMAGNIVYIRFDHVQVRTKKGKKKTIVQENAVHAVAESFWTYDWAITSSRIIGSFW